MYSEGTIVCPASRTQFRYSVKHHGESSPTGIDGGKISELTIKKIGESQDVVSFNGTWIAEPTEETEVVLAILMIKYN